MAKKKVKQAEKPTDSSPKSSEMKKIEEKKTEKPAETEEQLKKKVESLVGIIEELSSNVDKQGLPEVENVIETKLKDLNEKFEYKLQDFKNTLDSLEKKAGRGRSKDDINTLVEEIKKTIEPRFSTIEEKLGMLDRLETAEQQNVGQQATGESNNETSSGPKPMFFQNQNAAPNFELDQIRKSINEMNQALSSVKEQMDIIKDGVKAQGLLDSQDVQKLERILLSLEDMIPQRSVIDNFRVAFREINDLKKKIDDFNSETTKIRQIQESQYENISSRLETLVKYLNSVIEERDENYSELDAHVSEMNSKLGDLGKNQEYIFNNIKAQKEHSGAISSKVRLLDDIQRDMRSIPSKEEFKKFSLDTHSKFNILNEKHQIISNELKSLNEALESMSDKTEFIEEIQSDISDLASKNDLSKFEIKINSRFDTLDKNQKYIFDEIRKQKQNIDDIFNQLRILADLRKITSKDDLRKVEDNLKKNINMLQDKIQDFHNSLNKVENTVANKSWVKDTLVKERESLMSFVDNKINRLQKNIEDNTKKNNEIIKKIISEKRDIETKLSARRQKISTILRELRS